MRLTVLFFGVLRERFGDEERLEQFPGSTAGDLLRYYRVVAPELGDLWSSIAVAVNRTYATGALLLSDGDEVALLPPVSGGSQADRNLPRLSLEMRYQSLRRATRLRSLRRISPAAERMPVPSRAKVPGSGVEAGIAFTPVKTNVSSL